MSRHASGTALAQNKTNLIFYSFVIPENVLHIWNILATSVRACFCDVPSTQGGKNLRCHWNWPRTYNMLFSTIIVRQIKSFHRKDKFGEH